MTSIQLLEHLETVKRMQCSMQHLLAGEPRSSNRSALATCIPTTLGHQTLRVLLQALDSRS